MKNDRPAPCGTGHSQNLLPVFACQGSHRTEIFSMTNNNRPVTPTGVGAKPWLKMRTDLWDDPRVAATCDALEIDEARVIGGLYRLWSIADAHSVDGHLPGVTVSTVDRKTGIAGFATALASVRWLFISDDGVTIPDFEVHNGQSAKSRAQNSLRQQARRSRKIADSDASRTKRDSNASDTRPQCVTGMTRLDKSREEKNKQEPPPPSDSTSGEPATPEPVGGADALEAVGEELISSGVGDWRRLLDTYGQTGCSAEHALELIEFWKQHQDRFASPVGALHHRMENAHPSIPADERWPGLQTNPKPKAAPEIDIGRYTAAWSKTRPSRRAELARQAQIDLTGFEGQGLRELPATLRNPIVELLAREAGDQPPPSDT